MRRESELWWKQAQKDLEAAEKNLDIEQYYLVAFLCQQAVEKALKALFLEVKKLSPGTTHSLIYLATNTNVPKSFFTFLQKLGPEFTASRYPDVADEAPYLLYSEEKVNELLIQAKELFIWIKSQIIK